MPEGRHSLERRIAQENCSTRVRLGFKGVPSDISLRLPAVAPRGVPRPELQKEMGNCMNRVALSVLLVIQLCTLPAVAATYFVGSCKTGSHATISATVSDSRRHRPVLPARVRSYTYGFWAAATCMLAS